MAEIRWTIQAADDLENIVNFISADSEYYARLLAVDILESVERVGAFPESCSVVPEMNLPEIRETQLGNYRIIYRIKPEVIEILMVYHGARLLDTRRLE
ncbi:MAG: type II toxin-antitoxin system RelE/ParE family toxin [Candidatus Latescibacterota bacterium]